MCQLYAELIELIPRSVLWLIYAMQCTQINLHVHFYLPIVLCKCLLFQACFGILTHINLTYTYFSIMLGHKTLLGVLFTSKTDRQLLHMSAKLSKYTYNTCLSSRSNIFCKGNTSSQLYQRNEDGDKPYGITVIIILYLMNKNVEDHSMHS